MARSLVLAVLVIFFVGVLVASAQQVNPCTRIHISRTAVTLFTTTDLSNNTATEDDEIQLRADREIRIDDCLLIAKGATARVLSAPHETDRIFKRQEQEKERNQSPVAKPGAVH